jgi:hypothetical protein
VMAELTVRLAAFLLALVFAWAAVAKLVRWRAWREGLRRYRLGPLELPAAFGIPAIELAVVALLVAGLARAAAALTVAMLAGFCLAVLRARSFEGDRLPCNCFGADSAHDYKTMLIRNALLGIPAAVIMISGEDFYLFGESPLPSPGQAVPVAFVGIGLLVGAWMVRVVTTIGGGGGGD